MVIIVSGSFVLLYEENKVFKDVSLVYKETQFIAMHSSSSADISFLFIDSTGKLEGENKGGKVMRLVALDGAEVNIVSYGITVLKKPSFLSPYGLYRIETEIDIKTISDEPLEFEGLRIDEKEYDIGSLVVQSVPEQDYPNVTIGTSPHSDRYERFTIVVENLEEEPVVCTGVKYIITGKEVNGLPSNLVIESGKEIDYSFATGLTSKRYTIRPVIVYEFKGKEYKDVPYVATEYTTSLSKEEIIEYLKEQGNNS
jgi:hypothetical protein